MIWREIAKGRIIEVDVNNGIASGEVYTGSSRQHLECVLEELEETDLLEVDQYGASAKVLSGLAEYQLVEDSPECGLHGSADARRHGQTFGSLPEFRL